MSTSSLALALRQSKTPDDMYRQSFQYFQAVCRLHPNANQRGITILAHDLPEGLRGNRAMMGATMSGAIVAILDHETQCGSAVPPELEARLDEIIIEQAAITGWALPTSDLVSSRVSEWERTDGRKYNRWLKALAKAGRIHRGEQPMPVADPFLKDQKRLAVPDIRLVMNQLKERARRQRGRMTNAQIMEAMVEEMDHAELRFLNHEHNRPKWLEFFRRDPLAHVNLSAERLFDAYDAFIRLSNSPDRSRQQISLLK